MSLAGNYRPHLKTQTVSALTQPHSTQIQKLRSPPKSCLSGAPFQEWTSTAETDWDGLRDWTEEAESPTASPPAHSWPAAGYLLCKGQRVHCPQKPSRPANVQISPSGKGTHHEQACSCSSSLHVFHQKTSSLLGSMISSKFTEMEKIILTTFITSVYFVGT